MDSAPRPRGLTSRDAIDRIATTVFCLGALCFGWWLGGGFPSKASPAHVAAPAPERYFLCDADEGCDEAYETYLENERVRAMAWRHGGP